MDHYFQVIDRENWKRNMHCQIFQNSLEPQYCISLELDITHFLKWVKAQHYSFTFALIYAIGKCANEIEEFRYRFLNGNVILYDTINTSFTYLNQETELFKFVNVPMQKSFVVEADIKSFFDEVDHGWMLKFLEHDIADKSFLEIIEKFLNAGIMENK